MKAINMKTASVTLASLLLFLGGPYPLVLAQPASAHQQSSNDNDKDVVNKTFVLKYASPAAVLRLLQGSNPQNSLLPEGIQSVTPRPSDYSLTVRGAAEAVAEMEALITLLDVKPHVVKVDTRLFEIQRSKDGTLQETLLQSPVIMAKNNVKAQCTFSTEDESTSIGVVPHVNGDGSITLQVHLALSRFLRTSRFTAISRLSKPQEWTTVKTVSLSRDKKVQEAVRSGANPPAAAYPLYRLEVAANNLEQ